MTAATGRTKAPRGLRIIQGKGTNAAGQHLDSGGRVIEAGHNFKRLLPEKPGTLSPDAEWMWDLVCQQLERMEILKPLDAASLEVACETYARWKEAVRMRLERGFLSENSQGMVTAPWVGIEERAAKDFRAWCSEYGLTPAAEGKLISNGDDTEENESPF